MDLIERVADGAASDIESADERAALEERTREGAHSATRTVRVMTYNILSGGWPRVDALEAVMRAARADVIGMQEVDPRTLEALAARLSMYSALSPSARRGSPVGLLSRWPLRAINRHAAAPLRNALLEAVIAPDGPDGVALRVFVTHLVASYAQWRAGEGERLRELAYILGQMRAANERSGEPQLLMGDFNSLPPGERLLASQLLLHVAHNDARRAQGHDLTGQPGVKRVLPRPLRPLADTLVRVVGLPGLARVGDAIAAVYTPRAVVRATRAAGLVDLYTIGRPDPGAREMSCPAERPAGRIDYIFASSALAEGLVACDLLADAPDCPVTRASDHRPALATLALPTALSARAVSG